MAGELQWWVWAIAAGLPALIAFFLLYAFVFDRLNAEKIIAGAQSEFDRGQLLQARRRVEKAIEKISNNSPGDGRLLRLYDFLVNVHEREKDLPLAIEYQAEKVKIVRFHYGDKNLVSQDYLHLGELYLGNDELDKARDAYDEVVALNWEEYDNQAENIVNAQLCLSFIYLLAQFYEESYARAQEADRIFREAKLNDSRLAGDIDLAVARSAKTLGKLDEATALYKKLLQSGYTFSVAGYELANLYRENGLDKEAEELQSAIDNNDKATH